MCTHHPPTPTAIAVVSRPASSMIGRYQAEIFTERMWAAKSDRFRSANRELSTSSRPNACTTRTPAMPFLQLGQRGADAVADVEVGLVRVALELHAGDEHGRQADEAEEQQLPRHGGEHEHRHGQQEPVADEHQQAHLHELLQRVDVARHAGHDHARLLAVVERHRQALQVVEHADAQVPQERLADAADEPHLPAIGDVRRRSPRARSRSTATSRAPASSLSMPASIPRLTRNGPARVVAVQSETIISREPHVAAVRPQHPEGAEEEVARRGGVEAALGVDSSLHPHGQATPSRSLAASASRRSAAARTSR